MTRDDLIEKVQAILAKTTGRGATEAEAQTAVAFAQRLMAEHNLTMAEVEGYEAAEEEWTRALMADEAKGFDEEWIRPILSRFFFVRTILSHDGKQYRTLIFGTRENVDNARWVYAFLRRTFRDLWADYRRHNRTTRGDVRTYYAGLNRGFVDKLVAERKAMEAERPAGSTGTALAVVQTKLDAAFKSHFPRLATAQRSPLSGSSGTYEAGRAAGRNINLARPLDGGRKALPR